MLTPDQQADAARRTVERMRARQAPQTSPPEQAGPTVRTLLGDVGVDLPYSGRVAQRGLRSAAEGLLSATPPGLALGGLGMAGAGLEALGLPGDPRAQEAAQRLAQEPLSPFAPEIEETAAAVPLGEQLQMLGNLPSQLLGYLIGGGEPESPGEAMAQSAIRGAGMGGTLGLRGVVTPLAGLAAGATSGLLGEGAEQAGAPWYVRLGVEMLPWMAAPRPTPSTEALTGEVGQLGDIARRDLRALHGEAEAALTAQQKAVAQAQKALDVRRGDVVGKGVTPVKDTMTDLIRQRSAQLMEAGETEAVRALQSAEKALGEGAAFAADEARQALKQKYRLQAQPGYAPVDPLEVARDVRTQAQRARAQAYAPLRDRYQAWDAAHGNKSILIDASEAADLKRTADEILRQTRRQVGVATDDVLRGMLHDTERAAGQLGSIMEQIAVGEGALPIRTRDLRSALTSLKDMSREALPGDASRRVKAVEGKLEGWLKRHPDQGAYQALRDINQEYRSFKKQFEGNRLMRPLLDDYLPVERAVDGLKTAEVGELLQSAIGREGLEDLVRYRLSDVFDKEPARALRELPSDRVLSRALPRQEYKQLVDSLKAEGSRTTAESLLRAQNSVERALESPSLSEAARSALLETQGDLNRRLGRLRSPEIADARRAIQRSVRARDSELATMAQKAAVEGDYRKVVEALNRDIPVAELTPERISELMATAGRKSVEASNATARALLDRFLGESKSPQELLERIAQHGPQIQSLIGRAHAEELTEILPRLASYIDQMSPQETKSILESVAKQGATRQARQWAQAAFKGTRSYLKASLLQSAVTSVLEKMATRMRISGLRDALTPGGPPPKRALIVSLLTSSHLSPSTAKPDEAAHRERALTGIEKSAQEKVRQRMREKRSTLQP